MKLDHDIVIKTHSHQAIPSPFTITLTGGTFDVFDGNCDGQSGLHNHFPVNVMVTVMESLGVNRPLYIASSRNLCTETVTT